MRRYDTYFDTFRPSDGKQPPSPALLYDAWSLMDHGGFWPAHFYDVIDDEDLIAGVWRVGPDVVEEMGNRLTDPATWPLFEVDLGAGSVLAVIYRNFEDELGIDYLVSAGHDGEWIEIASIEGHFRGPGLSWPELSSVSRRQRADHRARTLLLLAPILGDIEAEQHVQEIADAIRACGGSGDVETLATAIASENRYFEAARWSTTPDGSVCDAYYARRTSAMPRDDRRAVTDALSGGG